MPKSYSEQERAYIRKRLKEEGAKCLAQYGIRRTTVDEIVKRVKIPKGTFYLFYQSKELLLFDIILEQHETLEKELYASVGNIKPETCNAEQLTDIIFNYYKLIDNSPALKMLNSDEIELLARKLPPNVIESHLTHDFFTVKDIFSMLPLKQSVDIEALNAAFLAIYCSTLYKEKIGEDNFDKAMRLLIKGLVYQIM